MVNSQQQQKVYGGSELSPHTWPFAVRMRRSGKWPSVQFDGRCPIDEHCGVCGASIINEQWLLSAAHCCVFPRWKYPNQTTTVTPADISFAVGAHYDESCDTIEYNMCFGYNGSFLNIVGEIFTAQKIIIHPGYERIKKIWDFCLIQVDRYINLDGYKVNKIHLPG